MVEAGEGPRIFYGYTMLPLATLILAASTPGQTFGVSFFNEHFRAACGLKSTGLAALYLVATVAASLSLPYLGGVADRIGLRRSVLLTIGIMSLVCLFGSTVSNTVALFVLFLLLRTFGPGCLTLLANNTTANWFDLRLGVASGAMQFGMAISFGVVPTVIVLLIDLFGWRGAYVALAAMLAALMPLLVWLYREHPREVGDVRDGSRVHQARRRKSGRERAPDRAYTLSEAKSTRAFWLMLVAAGTWTAVGTGLVFHAVPLFGEYGLGTRDATYALGLLAVGMGVMQVLGGVLADRVPGHWMAAGAVGSIGVSCVLIAAVGRPALLPAFGFYGMAQGAMTIVASTVWARYYGRRHLGKIRGASLTAAIGGSSIGPLVMGVSVDYLGGFTPSLWIMAAVALLVSAACFGATDPGAREER